MPLNGLPHAFYRIWYKPVRKGRSLACNAVYKFQNLLQMLFKVFLGIEVVGIFAFVAVVDHIGAVIQLINAFFSRTYQNERIEFLLT